MFRKLMIFVLFILLLPCISSTWPSYLNDDLQGYFTFNESSGNALDSVFGDIEGVLSGGVTQGATGKIDDAYDFDGTNGMVNFTDVYDYAGTNFSIALWANVNNLGKYQDFYGKYQFDAYDGWWLRLTNGNVLQFCVDGCSTGTYIRSSTTLGTGWNHVVLTAQEPDVAIKLYINGNEVSYTSSWDARGWAGLTSNAHSFTVGIGDHPDSMNFDGIIDEVAVYNRTLNASEVLAINNSLTGYIPSPPADTCTCPGLNQDWEIAMSDNCEITDDCDLGTGTLSFTGAGITKIDAVIKTTNLGDPGASGLLSILDDCIIYVS